MIIWHDLDHRDVTLSADPQAVAGCPINHLLDPDRGSVFRAYGDVVEITGRYPYRRWLNALALVRHFCSSAAKWRLYVYGDQAMTEVTYDSDYQFMLPVKPLGELILGIDCLGASVYDGWHARISTLFFEPVPCFGWRLEIIDDGATMIQASRLVAGVGWQAEYQPAWGAAVGWSDDGKSTRTEAGSSRTEAIEPYRKIEVSLEVLPPGDRATLLDLARRIGTSEDLIVSLYPDAVSHELQRDGLMHAHFSRALGTSHTRWAEWASPISFEEL